MCMYCICFVGDICNCNSSDGESKAHAKHWNIPSDEIDILVVCTWMYVFMNYA